MVWKHHYVELHIDHHLPCNHTFSHIPRLMIAYRDLESWGSFIAPEHLISRCCLVYGRIHPTACFRGNM